MNNIVSAKYVKSLTGINTTIEVIYDEDKIIFVPVDSKNTDYQEILKWVADGNTIQEAD
jgi:predicted glycosyltransferase